MLLRPLGWTVLRASDLAALRRELAEERRLLHAFMDNLPDFIFFKDSASRIVRSNKAHVKALGFGDTSEVAGKTDFDLFRREVAEGYFQEEQAVIRGAKTVVGRIGQTPEQDGMHWRSETKVPVRDEQGNTVGLVGISRDVTDLVRAQEAHAQEEKLLHAFMDSIPDFIFFKDSASRIVRSNKAHVKALGFSEMSEVIGKTDFDLFPRAVAQGYFQEEQAVMRGAVSVVGRIGQTPQSDGVRWRSETKVPVRDEQGSTVGLVGISRDVTDLVRAQEAHAREEELLHSLMDNIPDLIYFKDVEGRFSRVNSAMARFLGLTDAAAALGHRAGDFLSGESRTSVDQDEDEIYRAGRPVVGKVEEVQLRGGRSFWLLTTKVPLQGADGSVRGLVGISKDVSERKRSEEALEARLAEFQRFVSRVASGDLTGRGAEGADTLGTIAVGINNMVDGFSGILGYLTELVVSASSASREILAASKHIADGADQQAEGVHSTSASVAELAASMAQVSRNAAASSSAARQALAQMTAGDHAVRDTSEAIARIDVAVRHTADRMGLFAKGSAEIADIIDLINEIADQSNLLALNAAIEAAHAGDAGRAFGVVADEIRSLAGRSVEATQRVREIVGSIREGTTEVVGAMQEAMARVGDGRRLGEQGREALGLISRAVSSSADLADEISRADTEHAEVMRAIVQAMEKISRVTDESSSSAHQTAQTIEVFVRQINELNEVVAKFRIRSGAPPVGLPQGPDPEDRRPLRTGR